VTENQRALSIRILREHEVGLTNKNKLIRSRFGERITIALTQECAQRDREIDALNAAITLLDDVVVTPA